MLFIVHHILNLKWYKNLFRGRYTAVRICGIVIDLLLVMIMLTLMWSSVVMSRHVFDFLAINSGMSLARHLHILGSYWGFILMNAHLGQHWSMVAGRIRKCIKNTNRFHMRALLFFSFGLLIAIYGVYVFIKRDFLIYIILQSEFVFLDYNESKILFYLDYLALAGLWIFIFHFLGKVLRKHKFFNKKQEVKK